MYVVSETETEYFLIFSKPFTDLIVEVQSTGRAPSVSTELELVTRVNRRASQSARTFGAHCGA